MRLISSILLFVILSFEAAASEKPIPGPNDCFWRGPFSADPYINIAYPDANVYYWAAVFSTPEGTTLEINGDYPYSRYMSFFSYNERGKPIESITDYQIDSKAINPFIPGNNRLDMNRAYSIEVVHDTLKANVANTIYSPQYRNNQQLIVYRIYLPDENTSPTGGMTLPQPVLTLSDGTKLKNDEACKAMNASQFLTVSFDALGIPPNEYRMLISQPDKPDTWPAHNPTKWFIQLDRKSCIGMYVYPRLRTTLPG